MRNYRNVNANRITKKIHESAEAYPMSNDTNAL